MKTQALIEQIDRFTDDQFEAEFVLGAYWEASHRLDDIDPYGQMSATNVLLAIEEILEEITDPYLHPWAGDEALIAEFISELIL